MVENQRLVVTPLNMTVEEGGTGQFTVALAAQPSSDVTVDIVKQSGGDASLTASQTELTFTSEDWSQPKTVTINSAEDMDSVDGTAAFVASSTNLDSQTVAVTVQDNNRPVKIASIVAAEAVWTNGKLESNEPLRITWAASSPYHINSQTVTIDGQPVTTINGPYGGLYYSCSIGTWSAGSHTYVIQAKNAKGLGYSTSGTFSVADVSTQSPIASVVVAEATRTNGKLESNEPLRITWAASIASGIDSQTVTVDGHPIAPINGPYSKLYYSCPIGTWSAGSHTYSIRLKDSKGATFNSSGTFTVAEAGTPSPAITSVVVAEAAWTNGILESTESLRITWAAPSSYAAASQQTITVDGRPIAPINGPYGGQYCSCTIGMWSAGSHTYSIRSTDAEGDNVDSSGTFTVVAGMPVLPNITSVVVAEAAWKNGILEPNEPLRITWAASSANGIASQTMTVDGKTISPIKGPYSDLYYSCPIGGWTTGSHSYTIHSTDLNGVSSTSSGTFSVAAALKADTAAVAHGSAALLTDAQLAPIVTEAMRRWETQLGSQVETAMAGVKVDVANLSTGFLGETLGKAIWIDDDASGYGWFVDPTPSDDAEFVAGSGASLTAPANTAAAQRADLLTAVMHEMGHVLGYGDTSLDDLMAATLPLGTRRVNL